MMGMIEQIKGTAAVAADAALRAADVLAQKGREQARRLVLEQKLSRAQQQLGALIYALRRNGAENEPLVARYVEAIEEIEAELAVLRNPAAEEETTREPGENACPVCGAAVDPDALFCSVCGEKL